MTNHQPSCCGGGCATRSSADQTNTPPAAVMTSAGVRSEFLIRQMDCPTEEALIRGKLTGMVGVHGLSFNLMQRILTVDHEASALDTIRTAIRSLGFEPEDPAAEPTANEAEPSASYLPLAVAGLAAVGAEAADWLHLLTPWLPAALALLAVGFGGLTTYRKGWTALANRKLNIKWVSDTEREAVAAD